MWEFGVLLEDQFIVIWEIDNFSGTIKNDNTHLKFRVICGQALHDSSLFFVQKYTADSPVQT